jgi:uncharacterized lipoprotein YajG
MIARNLLSPFVIALAVATLSACSSQPTTANVRPDAADPEGAYSKVNPLQPDPG